MDGFNSITMATKSTANKSRTAAAKKAVRSKGQKPKGNTKPKDTKPKEEILQMPGNHYDIRKPSDVKEVIGHVQNFMAEHKAFYQETDAEGNVKKYPLFHAYQFAGTLFGMSGQIMNLQMVMRPGNIANIMYQCEGILFNAAGVQVQNAIAFCESEEGYTTHSACSSMAQTRSMAKAYRLHLGWIMRAAGFEDTPGEEMQTTKKAAAAMKPEDFTAMFANCTTEADAKQVYNQNRKYHGNADFKRAAEAALNKGKENDRTQNPA